MSPDGTHAAFAGLARAVRGAARTAGAAALVAALVAFLWAPKRRWPPGR